jgi:GTP cyclohydrolase I
VRDVQSDFPEIKRHITKVGVRNVPVILQLNAVKVAAMASIYTNLSEESRGSHMSRLVEATMQACHEAEDVHTLTRLATLLREKLHANDSFAKFRFPYMWSVTAPESGRTGWLRLDSEMEVEMLGEEIALYVKVAVPYTSLCPCSKEISITGGAHNQRSVAEVRLLINPPETFAFHVTQIVAAVNKIASAPIFPILKREDEGWVTDQAYEHPTFVEDAVRKLSEQIDTFAFVSGYSVVCTHFESIHQHDAVAVMRGGLQ